MKTTITKRDKFQYAAIRFVNRVRRDLGLAPIAALRRGKTGKPWSCPITNSVKAGTRKSLEVSTGTDDLTVNGSKYVLPTLVESFVDRFDEGLYPPLVAK